METNGSCRISGFGEVLIVSSALLCIRQDNCLSDFLRGRGCVQIWVRVGDFGRYRFEATSLSRETLGRDLARFIALNGARLLLAFVGCAFGKIIVWRKIVALALHQKCQPLPGAVMVFFHIVKEPNPCGDGQRRFQGGAGARQSLPMLADTMSPVVVLPAAVFQCVVCIKEFHAVLLIAILLSVGVALFTGYRSWTSYQPGIWDSPYGKFKRTHQPVLYWGAIIFELLLYVAWLIGVIYILPIAIQRL